MKKLIGTKEIERFACAPYVRYAMAILKALGVIVEEAFESTSEENE